MEQNQLNNEEYREGNPLGCAVAMMLGVMLVIALVLALFAGCGVKRSVYSEYKDSTGEQIASLRVANEHLLTGIEAAERARDSLVEVSSGWQERYLWSENARKTEMEHYLTTLWEINYDTSKPTDSVTGKPPVSSETIKTTEKNTNSVSQTLINYVGELEQNYNRLQIDSEREHNALLATTRERDSLEQVVYSTLAQSGGSQTDERRGMNTYQKIMFWLGHIAAVGGVGAVAFKLVGAKGFCPQSR
jgi:hypothetical protein